MAKPTQVSIPKPNEPEISAFSLVRVGPGLWSARSMIVRGDEVLAYEETTADTRSASIGRIVRALERT